MGYDNIRGFHAKKMKVESEYGNKEIIALFVQIADSNTYVERNGRSVMSRSWKLFKPAEAWGVMTSVVKWAAGAESGMIRYKGREVGADTIIRAARNIIKNAELCTSFGSRKSGEPYTTVLEIAITDDKLKTYGDTLFRELEEAEKSAKEVYCQWDDYHIYQWGADQAEVAKFLKYSYLFDSDVMWSIDEPHGCWDF